MQDDWGRRGVSVSLGRGRPRRSAEKGHRGLSAMFLRAWSGPQAASSVHLSTEVPAGPLQEAGYEFHSVSEGRRWWSEGPPRFSLGAQTRDARCGRRRGPAPGSALRRSPALCSTLRRGSHIRAGKSSRLARERISKDGARAEPRSSWASRPTSRTARGPRPALVPDREALSSDTRWAGCPPIFWRIPPLRGGGEEPHTLRGAPAGARPAAGASLRASAP